MGKQGYAPQTHFGAGGYTQPKDDDEVTAELPDGGEGKPYNFMDDVDRRLGQIRDALVTAANTRGLDPEILLDMYDLLAEAEENIKGLMPRGEGSHSE